MITFTTFDHLTLEHNLRVDPIDRHGWMRSATSGKQRPSRLGAGASNLVALVRRSNAGRIIGERPPGDAISAAGQVQGTA